MCARLPRLTTLGTCRTPHADYTPILSPRVPARAAGTSGEGPRQEQKLREATFFEENYILRSATDPGHRRDPALEIRGASAHPDLSARDWDVCGCLSTGTPALVRCSLPNPNHSHQCFCPNCFLPGHRSSSQRPVHRFWPAGHRALGRS